MYPIYAVDKKIYATAGRTGRAKYQLCVWKGGKGAEGGADGPMDGDSKRSWMGKERKMPYGDVGFLNCIVLKLFYGIVLF